MFFFRWLLVPMILLLVGCSKEEPTLAPVDMTLAAETSLLPTTVWVALKMGYFADEGINLKVEKFDSGRNALENMLRRSDIDMATVAQTPVVFNSFKDEPYVIVATMAYSLDDVKVLGRRDHGIVNTKDLAGKKVGVTLRSTGHYFLEGFLAHYGLTLEDIQLQDVNASELQQKLISGELDAITTWEPHIYNAKKALNADQLTLMISPTPFRKDFYFTVPRRYAARHPERIERFLRAVIRAEQYIREHTEESKRIASEYLGVDLEIVERIWGNFMFEITLEQSILVSLENEAQWAVDIGAADAVPNYLDFIDYKPLLKVKADAVNLIH